MQSDGQYSLMAHLGGSYFFEISYRDGVFTDENGDKTGGWCSEIYKGSETTGIVFLSDSQKDCGMIAQDFYSFFMVQPTNYNYGVVEDIEHLIVKTSGASRAILSLITDTSTHQVLLKTISQLLAARNNALLALKLILTNRKKVQVTGPIVTKLIDISTNNRQCAEEALKEIVGELEQVG